MSDEWYSPHCHTQRRGNGTCLPARHRNTRRGRPGPSDAQSASGRGEGSVPLRHQSCTGPRPPRCCPAFMISSHSISCVVISAAVLTMCRLQRCWRPPFFLVLPRQAPAVFAGANVGSLGSNGITVFLNKKSKPSGRLLGWCLPTVVSSLQVGILQF